MSTATLTPTPKTSKLPPITALPVHQELAQRLKALDARLGTTDEQIRNRRETEVAAWRYEQTRALAEGKAVPPRPIVEVVELDEQRARLTEARGMVARELTDLAARESARVRLETQPVRLAIYRRQLNALKELLAASRDLEAYEADLVNRGYAVPHGSLVQVLPTRTQENGLERFIQSVQLLEDVAI